MNLNFFDQKFALDSYIWIEGRNAYIAFILSHYPGKGNLSRLFESLTKRGFHILVPAPFPAMEAILEHKGFTPRAEVAISSEPVEVWVLLSDREGTLEPVTEPSGFQSKPIPGWIRTKYGYTQRRG